MMEFWITLGVIFFALLFVGMSLPLRDEQNETNFATESRLVPIDTDLHTGQFIKKDNLFVAQ